jgi:hypothetical protein
MFSKHKIERLLSLSFAIVLLLNLFFPLFLNSPKQNIFYSIFAEETIQEEICSSDFLITQQNQYIVWKNIHSSIAIFKGNFDLFDLPNIQQIHYNAEKKRSFLNLSISLHHYRLKDFIRGPPIV